MQVISGLDDELADKIITNIQKNFPCRLIPGKDGFDWIETESEEQAHEIMGFMLGMLSVSEE